MMKFNFFIDPDKKLGDLKRQSPLQESPLIFLVFIRGTEKRPPKYSGLQYAIKTSLEWFLPRTLQIFINNKTQCPMGLEIWIFGIFQNLQKWPNYYKKILEFTKNLPCKIFLQLIKSHFARKTKQFFFSFSIISC